MTIQFIIVEKGHPHVGETCELIMTPLKTVQVHQILGKRRYKVKLINCQHGIDECFVNPNGLMEIE